MPAPSQADGPHLLRWFGPNITQSMLRPRPVDVSWIVRYKLLGGRIFVHKTDRAAILDNVTCSRSSPASYRPVGQSAGWLILLVACRSRIGPFEEMLRVAAYLFNLPALDFTMSFGDNQCCDRCGRKPSTVKLHCFKLHCIHSRAPLRNQLLLGHLLPATNQHVACNR